MDPSGLRLPSSLCGTTLSATTAPPPHTYLQVCHVALLLKLYRASVAGFVVVGGWCLLRFVAPGIIIEHLFGASCPLARHPQGRTAATCVV